MKTDNKYYTPDLEDFHVGMNYETLEDERTDAWEKYKVEDLQDLSELAARNSKYIGKYSEIRIKFLDESDIVECGWKGIIMANGEAVAYGFVIRTHNTDQSHDNVFELHIKGNKILIADVYEQKTLFIGTIKNKSELLKIMKQLSI